MKRVLFVACGVLLLAGCSEPEPSAQMETSPRGHEYARLYLPEVKDVAIRIAWPTDWARREEANQAVPYIGAELILSGGAEGYAAGQVGEKFADLKASGHLSSSADYLFGELTVPKENLDEAVKIANTHLRAPTLDQKWFDRIRDGFADNIAETTAQPAQKGYAALRWAIFGDGPLRRSLSVDPPELIATATRDDVVAWHKAVITSNGARIVIAGNVGADEAAKTIDALLDGLPIRTDHHQLPAPVAHFGPKRILLHVADAKTSTLTIMGPLPPTRDGGEFEDNILVSALGGNDQSILFDAIRTKLRAAYGFNAVLDAYTRDVRVLMLGGEVETSKVAAAEVAVKDAYKKFQTTGFRGDLAAATAPFKSALGELSKRAGDAAMSSLMGQLDGNSPDLVLKLSGVIDQVTQASIDARLRNGFPRLDQFVVLAVSPDANALPGACVIERLEDAKACR